MIAHAIRTLNSFKATGSNTDRTLIFQTVDQFFDFCATKTRIKHLIKIRKIKMGIRDLPVEKKNLDPKII